MPRGPSCRCGAGARNWAGGQQLGMPGNSGPPLWLPLPAGRPARGLRLFAARRRRCTRCSGRQQWRAAWRSCTARWRTCASTSARPSSTACCRRSATRTARGRCAARQPLVAGSLAPALGPWRQGDGGVAAALPARHSRRLWRLSRPLPTPPHPCPQRAATLPPALLICVLRAQIASLVGKLGLAGLAFLEHLARVWEAYCAQLLLTRQASGGRARPGLLLSWRALGQAWGARCAATCSCCASFCTWPGRRGQQRQLSAALPPPEHRRRLLTTYLLPARCNHALALFS